jgi:hypothetical protein
MVKYLRIDDQGSLKSSSGTGVVRQDLTLTPLPPFPSPPSGEGAGVRWGEVHRRRLGVPTQLTLF